MTALDWWKTPGSNYCCHHHLPQIHNHEEYYGVQKTALKGRWLQCGLHSRILKGKFLLSPHLCSASPLSLSFTSFLTDFSWVINTLTVSHASESLSHALLLGNRLRVLDLCIQLEESLTIPYSPSKLLEKSYLQYLQEYMIHVLMLLFLKFL